MKTKDKNTDVTEELTETEKLQSDLKDLQDLYANEIKRTKALVKEINEVNVKIIELQSLLIDNEKIKNDNFELLSDEMDELKATNTVAETRIYEKEFQIEMLKEIVDNLITS